MLKIYKKTILFGTSKPDPRLESLAPDGNQSVGTKLSNAMAIPAMIAGALVGTLVFSAFFALLLIPVSIIGFRAWWLLRKLKNAPVEDSLEAEYTVVSDTSTKANSPDDTI